MSPSLSVSPPSSDLSSSQPIIISISTINIIFIPNFFINITTIIIITITNIITLTITSFILYVLLSIILMFAIFSIDLRKQKCSYSFIDYFLVYVFLNMSFSLIDLTRIVFPASLTPFFRWNCFYQKVEN